MKRFKYKCNECGAVRGSRKLIREHIKLNHYIKGSKVNLRTKAKLEALGKKALPISSYYEVIEIKNEE